MAKVLEVENLEEKFIVKIEVSKKEFGERFNLFDDYLFVSKDNDSDSIKTHITRRGKDNKTMYILLPKPLKEKIKFKKGIRTKDIYLKKLNDIEYSFKLK